MKIIHVSSKEECPHYQYVKRYKEDMCVIKPDGHDDCLGPDHPDCPLEEDYTKDYRQVATDRYHQIARHKESMAEKEAQRVREFEAHVEKEAELNKGLEELEVANKGHIDVVNTKDKEIEVANKIIKEQKEWLATRDEQLTIRDKEIEELNITLKSTIDIGGELMERVQGLDDKLTAKDEEIEELKEAVKAEKDEQMSIGQGITLLEKQVEEFRQARDGDLKYIAKQKEQLEGERGKVEVLENQWEELHEISEAHRLTNQRIETDLKEEREEKEKAKRAYFKRRDILEQEKKALEERLDGRRQVKWINDKLLSERLEKIEALEEKVKRAKTIAFQKGEDHIVDILSSSPDKPEEKEPKEPKGEKRPKCPMKECDGDGHIVDGPDIPCREYYDCYFYTDEPEEIRPGDPDYPVAIGVIKGLKPIDDAPKDSDGK